MMDWKWEEIRGREEEEEEEKIQKSLANFFFTLPKTWGTPHAQTEEKNRADYLDSPIIRNV